MDVIYRRGKASVSEVRADLPDPPSYSAVRSMLGLLEDKVAGKYPLEGELRESYIKGPNPSAANTNETAHWQR